MKWPEVLSRAGCTLGNLWKFLFLFSGLNMTKEKSGRWRGSRELGGVYKQPPPSPTLHEGEPKQPPGAALPIHNCPLRSPQSPPGRTDGRSGLAPQPPAALTANTAKASQSPNFYTWRGTHQLSVPVINPAQLKQQGQGGRAVPALRQSRPRLPRYHLGRELAEQKQDRYRSGGPSTRNPRHPGWGAEAFCSTVKKERSRRGAAVSQPEILFPFPHRVTCQKQAKSSSNTSPHL